MVNDRAQIYTIEGITAGIIMIITAYLILSTTTIFTPGDVHITDMQLEQTGNDALAMLDTPNSYDIYNDHPNISTLSYLIQQNQPTLFEDELNKYLNTKPGISVPKDRVLFTANISNYNSGGFNDYYFGSSGNITHRENTVRVTRLVLVDNTGNQFPINTELPQRMQIVLVEVLLWRG